MGSGADYVGSRNGTDYVGSRNGADCVGSRNGADSGADCVGSRYGAGSVRWEMSSRTQVQRKSGFNIIKWNKRATKTTPRGKKQAGRQKTGAQSNIRHSHDVRQRISTGLQTQGDYIGRQTRATRETQLEPLKQWLSNKMGGDRQSTWEHVAPTNNKPCAQHTETSGGQPGHTSRTVTLINPILIKLTSRVLFGLSGTKLNSLWFWVHISTWS